MVLFNCADCLRYKEVSSTSSLNEQRHISPDPGPDGLLSSCCSQSSISLSLALPPDRLQNPSFDLESFIIAVSAEGRLSPVTTDSAHLEIEVT
jgi:hypothetical protein